MFDDVYLQDNYHIYDFVGRDPSRSPHGKIFSGPFFANASFAISK